MTARLPFDPAVHAWRSRRARAAAVREVPFYRESWLDAWLAASESAPVPAAAVAAEPFRFFPVAAPLRPGERVVFGEDRLGLLDALDWAAGPLAGVLVAECRPALLDGGPLSWGRAVRYRAVVDRPAAGDDLGGRQAALRAAALAGVAATSRAVVLGDAAQLAAAVDDLPAAHGRLQVVERVALADGDLAARLGRGTGAAVVVDPLHGAIGAVTPACGRLHVAWRAFAARSTPDGVAVTRLGRRRPRLVDVVPEGGGAWRTGSCPVHGAPTLEPR